MRQVLGGLLMAIGILIGGLSGLCMAFGVGSTLLNIGGDGEAAGLLPLVLLVGGTPFVLGVALFFAGRSLMRGRPGSPPLAAPAPLDPATMAQPDPDRERPDSSIR